VDEFITDVSTAYAWADIIICRAGALTVSEISVAGIPAIFIPYPYAIDNHQFHNADWLVGNNAACLIEQQDLTVASLGSILKKMLSDQISLKNISENLKSLAIPDATEKVVLVCEQACRSEHALNKRENKTMGEKNNAA